MQDPPRSSQRCGQHRPVRGWVDVERRDSERMLQKKVKGGEGLSVGAGTEGVRITKKLKIKKVCYGAQSVRNTNLCTKQKHNKCRGKRVL